MKNSHIALLTSIASVIALLLFSAVIVFMIEKFPVAFFAVILSGAAFLFGRSIYKATIKNLEDKEEIDAESQDS
jgi:uncharacterized membrane protein